MVSLMLLALGLVSALLPGPAPACAPVRAHRLRPILCAQPEEGDESPRPKRGLPKRKGRAKRSERKKPTSGLGFGAEQKQGADAGLKFTRTPNGSVQCACMCGSTYAECCAPLHEGGSAADPVALIRARYTAFKYRLPDYVMRTTARSSGEWRDDTAAWRKDLLRFCDSYMYEGIRDIEPTSEGDGDASSYSYVVAMVERGSIKMMDAVQTSRFERTGSGEWEYISGDVEYRAPAAELSSEA